MATPGARGQRSSPDWPVTSWVVWGILSPLWPPFPLCDVRRSNGMILKNPPSRTTRLMRGLWRSTLLTLSAHYESAQLLEGSSLKEQPDGWGLTMRAPAERRSWLASGRQQDAWSQVAHSLVNHSRRWWGSSSLLKELSVSPQVVLRHTEAPAHPAPPPDPLSPLAITSLKAQLPSVCLQLSFKSSLLKTTDTWFNFYCIHWASKLPSATRAH